MKPSLGIIGNVGVDGTAELLQLIVKEIDRQKIRMLPRIVIEGVEVDRADEAALLLHESIEPFAAPLRRSARRLAASGVDVIILACNTLHALEHEIRSALTNSQCEFLSIVNAVPRHIAEHDVRRIGIIGTGTTVQLFTDALTLQNISPLSPESDVQLQLNDSVHRIVSGQITSDESRHTQRAVESIKQQGGDAFLIACTDLSQFMTDSPELRRFDATSILAKAVVQRLFELEKISKYS